MVKIYIETYGCAANQDDTSIIKGLLKKENYTLTDDVKKANIIIVNTCIVKGKTESKVISKLKKFIEDYPNKKLIIAGCMPEAEYEICKKIAPKASLINTQHLKDITKIIKNKNKILKFLGKSKENKLNLPKITKYKDIVNIQIAEGCLSNCYFCITKLAKGNLHSFPKEDIIKEIKLRLKQGYKRINLTSTDNSCYGLDINTNLPSLLKDIIKIKGDFKVRIGMMNPNYAKRYLKNLIKIYKSKKVIKFIHLPIESGSNKVLKDMNRNYKVKDFIKIVKKFRKEIPDINISTDIITGYPSESKEDFNKTIELIKKIKPEVLNISKFTPRPKTEASKLKQLPSQIIKERSKKLSEEFKKLKK